MTKTRIVSLLMLPVVLGLAWMLFSSIKSKIDEAKEIRIAEERVIVKLKMIRDAQRGFLDKYGRYTSSWDSLEYFLKNDTIYNVEKKEIIKPRVKGDPRFYTNTDSIRVVYDTLGGALARYSLFPEADYPNFNPDRIRYIPGSDNVFELFTGEIEKGRVKVKVIEVIDCCPINKQRSDNHPSPKKWRLRFGSRSEVTVAGNWE